MERIPEDAPNREVKRFVESDGPVDWPHAETLKFLYRALDRINFLFFSPKDESQIPIPQAVLGIAKEDIRVLAYFRTTYNPNALPLEIVLNEQHINRPRWELCESLTHEALHLFQEYMVKHKQHDYFSCAGNYHNKQFCLMAKEIGLNVFPGAGFHFAPPDEGSQFDKAMTLIGVERPPEAKPVDPKPPKKPPSGNYWDIGPKPKGGSTLIQYTANECTRQPQCKLRSGRKDLHISCDDCQGKFMPVSA